MVSSSVALSELLHPEFLSGKQDFHAKLVHEDQVFRLSAPDRMLQLRQGQRSCNRQKEDSCRRGVPGQGYAAHGASSGTAEWDEATAVSGYRGRTCSAGDVEEQSKGDGCHQATPEMVQERRCPADKSSEYLSEIPEPTELIDFDVVRIQVLLRRRAYLVPFPPNRDHSLNIQ